MQNTILTCPGKFLQKFCRVSADADYSEEMMHAALEINMPNYANAIVSTEEILRSISAVEQMAEEVETATR